MVITGCIEWNFFMGKNLDDVIAILSLDDLRFADLLSEDRIQKLRNHRRVTVDKADFTALVLAAGIFGVLCGKFSKVSAALDLLEYPLGFRLGRGVGLGVCALRHHDEDVA